MAPALYLIAIITIALNFLAATIVTSKLSYATILIKKTVSLFQG